MLDDSVYQKVSEAIRKRGELSVEERAEDMVRRGVIDREGNVLLRMPSKPRGANPNGLKGQSTRKPKSGKPKKK